MNMLSLIGIMLGRIFAKEHEKVSGSESYKYVEPLIRKGSTVCIVSPYVDEYYARFLSRNSLGKRIHIISSSMDKEAIRILGKRFSVVRFLLAILLSAVELYLGILYSLYAYALIAVALTLIAGYFASITGNRNISLVMPKRFVHAKMYISENEAISGSANLTYRGMHRNVEMLEIMHDKESVESMSSTFWKMWKEYS